MSELLQGVNKVSIAKRHSPKDAPPLFEFGENVFDAMTLPISGRTMVGKSARGIPCESGKTERTGAAPLCPSK
jgi:hypothetical protein